MPSIVLIEIYGVLGGLKVQKMWGVARSPPSPDRFVVTLWPAAKLHPKIVQWRPPARINYRNANMTEPLNKDYDAGLAMRKQVMGEDFVANALGNATVVNDL
jgi:hypothetical protein